MLQPIIPLLPPVYTSCQAPFVFQPSLSAPLSHLGLMELRFTNLPWMWTLLECQTGMTSIITEDHQVYFSWKWCYITWYSFVNLIHYLQNIILFCNVVSFGICLDISLRIIKLLLVLCYLYNIFCTIWYILFTTDDVIKDLHYWPLVRGIHQYPCSMIPPIITMLTSWHLILFPSIWLLIHAADTLKSVNDRVYNLIMCILQSQNSSNHILQSH